MNAPCESWDVTFCCPLDAVSPVVTGGAAMAATEVMWALSGRQFGLCTVTVRPCRSSCVPMGWNVDHPTISYWSDTWPNPALINGSYVNLGCGRCHGACGCTEVSELRFLDDVQQVDSVVVDGVVLDPGAYRLDNHRLLVRLDGEQWPTCQDWNASNGDVGSWSVTMQVGQPVPTVGLLAVSELASEFVRALCNDRSCKLPKRIQEITRGGVTQVLLDTMEYLREGRTGLLMCDLFVQSYNPNHISEAPAVYSPDRMPGGGGRLV